MKPSLQLGLSQQLTLTPQLQQAIRLLQLSTLDLNQEIQEALESNPMLDVKEEHAEQQNQQQESKEDVEVTVNVDETTTDVNVQQETLPTDLPVDSDWDYIYPTNYSGSGSRDFNSDNSYNSLENRSAGGLSLQDHLVWQMQLTPFSATDEAIALAIIDATGDDGMLKSSIEDIRDSIGIHSEENPLELDDVEAVLHRVQAFDPPGICARDLGECLLLQLNQLTLDTPYLAEAKKLVGEHMNWLASREHKKIMRALKLTQDDFKGVIHLIKSLNPRPGSQISDNEAQYIVPDVIVKKVNGRWQVELNPDAVPRLKINSGYASLVRRANNSSDNVFLKNQLQEARWFIKSLQSRNETLLKVATSIVQRQQDFLEYGEEAMRPMVLHDIAEEVEMHESTISRVTTQKYMHTPRGIFELKFFFSSHVSTNTGGECSSTAIRALIKKLIAAENPNKPLSDNKIAQILADQGIQVARRTIAKYRESMAIPPSNERKYLTEE